MSLDPEVLGPTRIVLGDANVLYSRVLRDYLEDDRHVPGRHLYQVEPGDPQRGREASSGEQLDLPHPSSSSA
ncbi:MAG: hypothetical protein V9F03_04095 [Microthrixaceae bacterium]